MPGKVVTKLQIAFYYFYIGDAAVAAAYVSSLKCLGHVL